MNLPNFFRFISNQGYIYSKISPPGELRNSCLEKRNFKKRKEIRKKLKEKGEKEKEKGKKEGKMLKYGP